VTTVLITGASGSLGEKARAHLERLPDMKLRLFTRRNPNNDPTMIVADLTTYAEEWARHLEGVDVVLHLAADPQSYSGWASIQKLDVDLLNNIYFACVKKQVPRLVFASSNWTLAGLRFDSVRLSADVEPSPLNPYGAAKVFAERLGKSISEHFGLSVICLRIGYCQREEPNTPGKHMRFGRWGQEMWLSDGDWQMAVECAIRAGPVPFAVVNVVSNNNGMRWTLEEGERLLNWRPIDHHTPIMTTAMRMREWFARQRHFKMKTWMGKCSGWDW
jgi:NAD+ dependent glucose-6-phosphate dehydrogenase